MVDAPYDIDAATAGGTGSLHQSTAPAYNIDAATAPQQPQSVMSNGWSGLMDAGERGLGLGVRGVMEGAAALPGMLADAGTWPGRVALRAAGVPVTAPSDMVQSGINATGLPQPQTPSEKLIDTAVQGGTGALTTAGLGGVPAVAARVPGLALSSPTVANAARTVLQGGAGALGGDAAANAVPDALKPYARLVGGMVAGGVADTGLGLGVKGANALTGNMSDVYNAFQRLRIDPTLVGTVGGSELGQGTEAALSRMPFASSVVRPVQQRTIGQFGDAVDNTAARLDPFNTATNAANTGTVIQNAARDWKNNVFQAQEAQNWTPINQRLAGTEVDPSDYKTALDDVTSTLTKSAGVFTPANVQKLSDAFSQDVPTGGTMTWEQAQQLRSRIGKAMGVPDFVQSVGQKNLSNLYGGIASDMSATADAHGIGDQFKAANAASTAGHAFIDNVLSKVVRSNNPSQESVAPGQATDNLLNSDDSTLQALRQNMPAAADALGAYNVRQMGMAKPSSATAYNDTSTGTFLSNVNRMRQQQPGGYGALYSDPTVQQNLDDLSTVAQQLRQTERHLNTSGTAEQLGMMKYAGDVGSAVQEGEYKKALGNLVIPPLIGQGLGKVMTSPGLTRYVSAQGLGAPLMPPKAAGLLGAIPEITVRPQAGQ